MHTCMAHPKGPAALSGFCSAIFSRLQLRCRATRHQRNIQSSLFRMWHVRQWALPVSSAGSASELRWLQCGKMWQHGLPARLLLWLQIMIETNSSAGRVAPSPRTTTLTRASHSSSAPLRVNHAKAVLSAINRYTGRRQPFVASISKAAGSMTPTEPIRAAMKSSGGSKRAARSRIFCEARKNNVRLGAGWVELTEHRVRSTHSTLYMDTVLRPVGIE